MDLLSYKDTVSMKSFLTKFYNALYWGFCIYTIMSGFRKLGHILSMLQLIYHWNSKMLVAINEVKCNATITGSEIQ